MGVNSDEQGTVDLEVFAIEADRLSDRRNMPLIERIAER
jgi:hypothetical protein